jgi:flagellar assembly protein FliH
MSSSSEARLSPARRARVLRGAEGPGASAAGLLSVDLRPEGLARLDPARVDAAVEEGRARGHQEGWEAGRAEALAEARARAHAEAAATRAQLEALLAATEARLAEAVAQVSAEGDAMVERAGLLAGAIAEAVVGHELATHPEPATAAARRALALAPDAAAVTLRLAPDDAAVLDAEALGTTATVRVVADAALKPGDCIAEAGWTTVDARVGEALARVREALAADPTLSAASEEPGA